MSVTIKKLFKNARVTFNKMDKEIFQFVLDSIKSIEDAKYDKDTREWTIPDIGIDHFTQTLATRNIPFTIESTDKPFKFTTPPQVKCPELVPIKQQHAEFKASARIVRSSQFIIVEAITLALIRALDSIPKLSEKLPEFVIDIQHYDEVVRIIKDHNYEYVE